MVKKLGVSASGVTEKHWRFWVHDLEAHPVRYIQVNAEPPVPHRGWVKTLTTCANLDTCADTAMEESFSIALVFVILLCGMQMNHEQEQMKPRL